MENEQKENQEKIDAAKKAKDAENGVEKKESAPAAGPEKVEGKKVEMDWNQFEKVVILAVNKEGRVEIVIPKQFAAMKSYELKGILKAAQDSNSDAMLLNNIMYNINQLLDFKLGKPKPAPGGIILPGQGGGHPFKQT